MALERGISSWAPSNEKATRRRMAFLLSPFCMSSTHARYPFRFFAER
jgi:hypothetical protein